jgi:hypothetical protein
MRHRRIGDEVQEEQHLAHRQVMVANLTLQSPTTLPLALLPDVKVARYLRHCTNAIGRTRLGACTRREWNRTASRCVSAGGINSPSSRVSIGTSGRTAARMLRDDHRTKRPGTGRGIIVNDVHRLDD